ncbi:Protein N-acetyltransferase, RimJ/RimL family [Paenibacillus sp. yr247]|uniref:GNAT family N-acetyltransferase n=1 Tax=Paenibacillus sp. yr247 TaxID=1761880 RepID=UPI00088B4C6C|nr:GNAT family N-acetyltransferase [Paenibacillus sp. yr247]SDN94679.1 Protein N-acetyltransferase, RimJ/RimL family [Paenibacillus sp. yr247]
MIIRQITESDASAHLELCKTIDGESSFMLFEAGERKTTEVEHRERLHKLLASGNSVIFVAETEEGKLVGYLTAVGGEANRNKHSIYIVIGILKAFTGQRIGTKLFEALELWARTKGITRLSLGLMEPNQNAFALYSKMGFELEGRKKDVFKVDGLFVDELIMGKRLI